MTNSDSGTLVWEIISYSELPVVSILLFSTVYLFPEKNGRTACPMCNTSRARQRPSRPWVPLAVQTTLNKYALHATYNIIRNAPPPRPMDRVFIGAH